MRRASAHGPHHMSKIAIGIAGIGNCASSLLQGIEFYRAADQQTAKAHVGLMHYDVGGYRPSDIEVVCAFDVDQRKVGQPVDVAALAPPNNAPTLYPKLPRSPVIVEMGPVLAGVAEHMREYPPEQAFVVAERRPAEVAEVLRRSGAEILLNYLPVGSQRATEHYARTALEAGVSFVNCIPVFIASDPQWAAEFERRRIPIVGDDVKSQLGATIVHRMLAKLFDDRGVALDRTYQLNTGGNTDFLNMLNRTRTSLKRRSKTEAVQSVLPRPLPAGNGRRRGRRGGRRGGAGSPGAGADPGAARRRGGRRAADRPARAGVVPRRAVAARAAARSRTRSPRRAHRSAARGERACRH